MNHEYADWCEMNREPAAWQLPENSEDLADHVTDGLLVELESSQQETYEGLQLLKAIVS